MKAVTYERYGPPDVLRIDDVATPVPKPGEVLVRVHAASVNSWDFDLLTGKPITRLAAPFRPRHKILGADIAGVVEAVGDNVTRFKPGQAVFGDISECGWGGFAEYVAVDARYLAAKPDDLSFTDASAIPQAGSLALQGLRGKRPVKPGDKVLINGAGGGAGTFAIQIAKADGAEVTGVDSAAKQDLMRAAGADHVLDYRAADYTATGERYDIILDMVAHRSMFAYRRALRSGGRFIMVGGTVRAIFRCFTLGSLISVFGDRKLGILLWRPRSADYEALAALALSGKIRPIVDRVYPLAEAGEALRQIGEGNALGKVVVSVAEDAG